MNAASSKPEVEAEAPQFYSPRIVSAEETQALLAQQREREAQTPGSGVLKASFTCSNRCSVCLHSIACHEDTES